jgi:hypothetical protein
MVDLTRLHKNTIELDGVYLVRYNNIRQALRERGRGGQAALSRHLGHAAPSMTSSMLSDRPSRRITEDTARAAEEFFDFEKGTLDVPLPPLRRDIVVARATPAGAVQPEVVAQWLTDVRAMVEAEGIEMSFEKFTQLFKMALSDAVEHEGVLRPAHIRQLISLLK